MNADEIILKVNGLLGEKPIREALKLQAQEIFKELEEHIPEIVQDYEKVSGKNPYLEIKKKCLVIKMKKTITIEVELNNVKEFRDEDTKEIVSESVGQGLVEAVCKYISEKISVYADKESKEFDVMDEQLLNESGEDWLCEGPESLSEYGDFTIKIK